MDSPLRLDVASLVRQRGAGEISRDAFFEQLAALQTATAETAPAAYGSGAVAEDGLQGDGLGDSWASAEGFWQMSGLAHATPFESLDFSAQPEPGLDGEDLHDWSAGPPLLTGEAARALILGNDPRAISGPSGQVASAAWRQPAGMDDSSGFMMPSYSTGPQPPAPSMAWMAEPEPLPAEAGLPVHESLQWQDFAIGSQSLQWQDFVNASDGWLPSPYGIASTRLGQEALGIGLGGGPLPSTPPLPLSPSHAPAQPVDAASPYSPSLSPGAGGGPQRCLTPEGSFAGGHSRRSYGSTDSPRTTGVAFAQRSELWEMQRMQRAQELRRQRDAREQAECSFHPNAAPGSQQRRGVGSAASSSRGRAGGSRSSGCLNGCRASELAERLSRPLSSADRDALNWQARRDREELQECTFQPDISRSTRSRRRASSSSASFNDWAGEAVTVDASHGHSRCMAGGATGSQARRSRERAEPQLFVPLTNDVPRDMVNARAYLSEDVFSRLVQPSPDALATQGSISAPRASSTGPGGGMAESKASELSTMSRCRSGGSINLSDESFLSFLHRQNTCEEWRRERLHCIKMDTAPSLRPELCNRSVQLASRHRARCEHKKRKR